MRKEIILLFILWYCSCGCPQKVDDHSQQQCPTWFVPQSNHTGDCKCGNQRLFSGRAVKCEEHSNQSMLGLSYCMTYNEYTDESTGVTVVGGCPYNSHKADLQEQYVKLPQNISHLNEFMCGGLDRTGLLCSCCKKGLGIPVFSYTLHCIPCLGSFGGWLLYLFLAVFPTTIFFLIVIIFQIRVTSAPMNAFIFICQVFTNLVNSQPYTILTVSPFIHIIAIVFSTFCGFWNLDFFRYVIPSFCVSDQLTPIQVVALEYVVAFYPLLLIVTTYICVELHARDCRLIVWLWRPFSRCLVFVLRGRELEFSLVHAFASFLLLSYSKILFVSFQLLAATELLDANGQVVGPAVVFYDASVGYFSATHLPLALLAICVLCVFVVLPALVLLLYPTTIFQRSLGCCRVRWLALHAFADTFNGYYKNGTEGTRDYRYFAGLYVILRIVHSSVTAIVVLRFIGPYSWMVITICYAVVSLLFALLRPYKEDWINIWDSVMFGLLSFSYFWMVYAKYVVRLPLEVIGVIAVVPFVYIATYILHKMYINTFKSCCVLPNKYRANPQLEPDRLLNPEEYRQLLPNANCPENEHSISASPDSRGETYPACGNSLQVYGSV